MSERETPNTLAQDAVTISWFVSDVEKDSRIEMLRTVGKIGPVKEHTYEPQDPEEIESSEWAPLVIIVGVIAITYLADVIINLSKDMRYGGLIVKEKENGELDIREQPSLNRGEGIFVDAHGNKSQLQFNNSLRIDIVGALKTLVGKK